MLEADIQLRLGKFALDAAFSAASGKVVALLGPNGSGKSTVLRALMGLLPLAGGRVVLDGTVLDDPAQHTRVPPEKRPIALMFQDYLLFPHLSALENVAFGLRATGTDKNVARLKAAEALAHVGLEDQASKRPGSMSGGQQQRVAMARALVTEPKLLLLDEPLAALDVSTKTDIRRLLRATLRRSGAANMLVTHDLLDAVALGDRMIVIENGGIVQTGTPRRRDSPTEVAVRRGPDRRQPPARNSPRNHRGPRRRRPTNLCQPRNRASLRRHHAGRGKSPPGAVARSSCEPLAGNGGGSRPHGRSGPGAHRRGTRDHGRSATQRS
jgi:ABC-type Fe3+/spermidine/putrescine transport system ATPase subunit